MQPDENPDTPFDERGDAELDDLLPGPLGPDGPDVYWNAVLRRPGRFPTAPAVQPGVLLLGRYRLLAELGRGGNGLVFEARDEQLDRPVALKVLHPIHAGDPALRERFEKESRMLSRLEHPGIVTIRAFQEDADHRVPVLVMDLVPGKDLGSVLTGLREVLEREEHRSLPEPQDGRRLAEVVGTLSAQDPRPALVGGTWFRSVAQVGREVVRVLEAAHERGIIHRDLTPRNVMIGPGGWPVILDFGLGGVVGSEPGAITQSLHGTPGYLAPEQLGARRTGSDPRTDVYQVGLLLYELLTLRTAYVQTGTVGAVLERVRRGLFATPRELNRTVPPELEAICLRAMELDPQRRYASVRELGRDLDRWLDGLSPLVAGTRWPTKLVRGLRYRARHHPRLSSVIVATLAASAVVAGGFFYARDYLEMRAQDRPLVRYAGAWRCERGSEHTTSLSSGEPVRPGDWLGVEVESDVPAYVYSLSLVGPESAAEQYMMPVRNPRTLADYVRESSGEGAAQIQSRPQDWWGLQVEAGRTQVALVEAGVERGEGLLVIAAVAARPDLEAWFDRLQRAHERTWPAFPGIPRDQAERIWAEAEDELERGQSLSELSAEERASMLSSLDPASVLEGAEWDSSLGARLEIWFPVHRE